MFQCNTNTSWKAVPLDSLDKIDDNDRDKGELIAKSSQLQREMKDLISEQNELRSQIRTLNGVTEQSCRQLLNKIEEIDTFLGNASDAKAALEEDRISMTSDIDSLPLRNEISAVQKLTAE